MSSRPALDPALLSHLISAQRLEDRRGRRGSGIAELDRLLGGGWPRAALCELVGRRSSGRTAILYAALARALGAGEAAALVDVGGGLDPRRALAAGIALPRLLWVRCAADAAAKAADLVLGAGGFDLIALDLGDERPRLPTAGWIRFKHGAEKQGTTLLVAAPARAAGSCAGAVVELAPGAPWFVADGAPLFAGLRSRAVRGRGGREPERAESEEARCASLAFSCRS
jgi:protein ImuA